MVALGTVVSALMANYENALQAAHSLWVASDSVTRREFNAFARSLDLRDRYPGLQGIGWRSLVPDGDRGAFLARARADGAPGFTIRPAGRRPVYYVTLYSYPRIPSSSTLGADASVAERRRTLAGWATGQFRAQDFLDAAMKPWHSQASMGVELHDGAVPDGGPVASWPPGSGRGAPASSASSSPSAAAPSSCASRRWRAARS